MKEALRTFKLDLSGLVVYTEAANGVYSFTPVIAALAGAARVHALTKDSRWASAGQVRRDTMALADYCGVGGRLHITLEKERADVAESDIVTNLGWVRPIDAQMVAWMKPTAAVPLMFESWEFRERDVDVPACRAKGIPVLGTNERVPEIDMFKYSGPLALRLLADAGLELIGNRIMVVGGGVFGLNIMRCLSRNGAEVLAACPETAAVAKRWGARRIGKDLRGKAARRAMKGCDALVVSHYPDTVPAVGPGGMIGAGELAALAPGIAVIQFFGPVDRADLAASGLSVFPVHDPGPDHMGVTMGALGPMQIIRLNAASLKVGEAAARARLGGLDRRGAEKAALKESPAMPL
jgi:hypothetical protein